MGINLLGALPSLPKSGQYYNGVLPKTNQPAGMSKATVGMNTPQGVKQVPIYQPPIGVKAKSATSNVPAPPTTLPAAQKSPIQPSPVLTQPSPQPLATAPVTQGSTGNNTYNNNVQNGTQIPTQTPTGNLYAAYVNSLAGGLQNSPNAQAAQGYTGNLAGGLQSSPNAKAAQYYTGQTANYGAGNIGIGQEANRIAQQYGQKYTDVGQKGAALRSGELTTGTSPVAQGNAAVTAQTTAAQQQVLAQGEQAALQGIGYQLTGQQQAANAANEAAGQAYTGQGQQLGALNNAAGLAYTGQGQQLGALQQAAGYAQPQLGTIGQVPYSPIDLSQGNILGTTQPGGIGAAGQLLGQFQGAQAAGAAPGQAQASNIQTGATAGVGANQAVLNPAYQNYLNLQQTTQNIDGFGNLLTQTMQQGGINPSDVKYANAKLADIRNALSSQQQAIYDNTLAGLRSRVSGLLAAGGSEIPTQITADANKILDGTLPLSALSGVLQRIQAEGNILLGNAANVVNTAYSGTQGGSQGGGGSVSGFGWDGK